MGIDRFHGTRADDLLHVLGLLVPDNVDDVIDGHDAEQPVVEIDHRQHGVVVSSEGAGDGLPVDTGANGLDRLLHELADSLAGAAQQQVAHADHALDAAIVGDHHQVLEPLGDRPGPDRVNGLGDGHVAAQREVIGGHQAAGRLAVVPDQVSQRRRGGQRHRGEQVFPERLRHLLEQVHRVVRRHGGHEPCRVAEILLDEVLHDPHGQGRLHLGEGLGRGVVVHPLQDVRRFVLGERFERVGGIRRLLLLDGLGENREVDRVLDQLRDALVVQRCLTGVLDVRGVAVVVHVLGSAVGHRPECTSRGAGWHGRACSPVSSNVTPRRTSLHGRRRFAPSTVPPVTAESQARRPSPALRSRRWPGATRPACNVARAASTRRPRAC